jgi:hypothetical protein
MKRRLLGFALVLVICGAAAASFAGYRLAQTTWVIKNSDGSGSFYGNYEGASANTGDNNQYVGCYFGTYGGTSVACWGGDPTGKSAYCQTSDPALVQNARLAGIATALYVQFNASGTCTGIAVDNSSYNVIR